MRHAYETMLWLYPPLHRATFGREMADVFEEATCDQRELGLLAYWTFLGHEFAGLVSGALAMWSEEWAIRSRSRVTGRLAVAAVAGTVIAALFQGLLYSGFAAIGRRMQSPLRLPSGPQTPVSAAMLLIFASTCLLLICIFLAAFVWNMRTLASRAGTTNRIWMPGRDNARIARRDQTLQRNSGRHQRELHR